ncbi:MAG: hypothetical protein ABW168_29230 [Sedimenticola sp.]
MRDLDGEHFSISAIVEYYDCLVEVVVFDDGVIEVVVRDCLRDTNIVFQSDDDFGCTGAAMLKGLKWAKNNDY